MQTTASNRSTAVFPLVSQPAQQRSALNHTWEKKNGLLRRTDKVHTFPRIGDVPLGIVRQRFYPEQWRRGIQSKLEGLARLHGHTLRWLGWDRSLPRLYLPSDQLSEALMDLVHLMLRKTPSEHTSMQPIDGRFGSTNELILQVSWQAGETPTLMIALEHPRLQLADRVTAAVNSPVPVCQLQESDDNAWVALRSLMRGLGGGLAIGVRNSKGSLVRISIPTDNRNNLVRHWLEQLMLSSGRLVGDLSSNRSAADLRLSLYAVGRHSAESSSSLNAADIRLQSLASQQDLVYRAARSRWLWLTLYEELPAFIQRNEWQSQLVCSWNCPVSALFSPDSKIARPTALSVAIVSNMERILGNRVPPLDALPSMQTHTRRLRVDRPPTNIDGQTKRPIHASHFQLRPKPAVADSATPANGARWRYPI